MEATVSHLYIYPVKGCRGIAVDEATVAATGLEVDGIGDREWVVADAQDGSLAFLSQRELPRMALIETRLTGESLRLKAPGMLGLDVPFASEGDVMPVRVWNDTVSAVTQGDLADTWLSTFLQRPVRLLRFDPEHKRLAERKYTGNRAVPFKFADAFPLLITSQASLNDLNTRLIALGQQGVDHARFRPNIVLAGLQAYDEDHVHQMQIADDVLMQATKPCSRCTVPGVSPQTGESSPAVPDLLASYRRRDSGPHLGVMFGINAMLLQGHGQPLFVGDPVRIEWRFG